jgi:C-terminal processing protease CtpA/Prc
MKSPLFSLLGLLCSTACCLVAEEPRRREFAPGGTGARRGDLAPLKESKVQKMAPFNVREAVFPSIDVHFELSGTNLADSLNDPIVEARVTAVDDDGMGARLGIKLGDSFTSLNGTSIRGLTIRQLAALVAGARERKESLIWEGRRGLTSFTVRYNGKWDTPLPGLKR